jgi:hypothetical protein
MNVNPFDEMHYRFQTSTFLKQCLAFTSTFLNKKSLTQLHFNSESMLLFSQILLNNCSKHDHKWYLYWVQKNSISTKRMRYNWNGNRKTELSKIKTVYLDLISTHKWNRTQQFKRLTIQVRKRNAISDRLAELRSWVVRWLFAGV